jgi:hypothetical protein
MTEALAAASELPQVGLVEALELVLLLCDRAPARYERAALRWHGRYCREAPNVTLADGQAILALLVVLPVRASRPPTPSRTSSADAGSNEPARRSRAGAGRPGKPRAEGITQADRGTQGGHGAAR